MSVTDDVLKANSEYARSFQGPLPMPPNRHIAVLACMDARLQIEPMLGLKPGEAHIIRNAGAIATEDALRSFIISHQLLGTREFMIIGHTDCGMLTFKDEQLEDDLLRKTGQVTVAPERFHAFPDVEESVRRQVIKLQNHPWIAGITIRGFVFDVKTGKLNEVQPAPAIKKVA